MKFKVCNVNYEVIESEKVIANGKDDNWGCLTYTTALIELKKDLHSDVMRDTLFHELVHAMLHESHLEDMIVEDSKEDFTDRLGQQLNQFIGDNIKALLDIYNKGDKK